MVAPLTRSPDVVTDPQSALNNLSRAAGPDVVVRLSGSARTPATSPVAASGVGSSHGRAGTKEHRSKSLATLMVDRDTEAMPVPVPKEIVCLSLIHI